jgi:hypothetical protein
MLGDSYDGGWFTVATGLIPGTRHRYFVQKRDGCTRTVNDQGTPDLPARAGSAARGDAPAVATAARAAGTGVAAPVPASSHGFYAKHFRDLPATDSPPVGRDATACGFLPAVAAGMGSPPVPAKSLPDREGSTPCAPASPIGTR